MHPYVAELVGTAILILLGNGVVANVVLSRTKGHGGGWLLITAGWAFAVYTAVMCVERYSGAHLNPAVSVGLAAAGSFPWSEVPGFVGAQLAGAFSSAMLVYRFYRPHYDATVDAETKRATFCTAPALRDLPANFFGETVATLVLVFAVLCVATPSFDLGAGDTATTVRVGMGSLGALPVSLIVFAIGLSLGGTTGFAINPARDLGPRLAHALLPIPGKGSSAWDYAWVPIVAPIIGALIAAGGAKLAFAA
jgi:glycerol uptake facilitator protein